MGGRDGAVIRGAALNEAPYGVAEAPLDREVECEVLTDLAANSVRDH
jgi:hypothetical protein